MYSFTIDLRDAEQAAADGSGGLQASAVRPLDHDASAEEHQLSLKATSSFLLKDYEAALGHLNALYLLRPFDPKVALNVAVVVFKLSREGIDDLFIFQKALKNIYHEVLAKNGGDFEFSDHLVLVYNFALCCFYRKYFALAERILVQTVSTMAVGPTAPSASDRAFLVQKVLPLLISVCLCLHAPKKANAHLCDAEALVQQLEEEDQCSSSALSLLRAQILVMTKQYKTFKRDLKLVGLDKANQMTYEFLRANMEFVKGNYRKASKLMAMVMQPLSRANDQLFSSYASSLYLNNLGCIDLMLKKPHTASMHFHEAIAKHNEYTHQLRGTGTLKKDCKLTTKQVEIVYNLGLALLQAGNPLAAFEKISLTCRHFSRSPSLWLHMAECCIQAHKGSHSLHVKHLYGPSQAPASTANTYQGRCSTCLDKLGSSHKLVMTMRKPSKSKSSDLPCSLEYARECLRTALLLLDQRDDADHGNAVAKGNGASSSTGSSAQSSPAKIAMSSVQMVRAAVLTNAAFVSLCLDDPVDALKYCKGLFQITTPLPRGYKTLGKLYAAEALMRLDNITEAIEHLDVPVMDTSFSDMAEAPSEERKLSAQAFRSVFQLNHAIAFALRGELDKSNATLDKLWTDVKDEDKFGLCVEMQNLRIYLEDMKGNIDKCVDLANGWQ